MAQSTIRVSTLVSALALFSSPATSLFSDPVHYGGNVIEAVTSSSSSGACSGTTTTTQTVTVPTTVTIALPPVDGGGVYTTDLTSGLVDPITGTLPPTSLTRTLTSTTTWVVTWTTTGYPFGTGTGSSGYCTTVTVTSPWSNVTFPSSAGTPSETSLAGGVPGSPPTSFPTIIPISGAASAVFSRGGGGGVDDSRLVPAIAAFVGTLLTMSVFSTFA